MLFDPVLSDNLTPNRVYDPMLGTWTSEDPMMYVNGGDLYNMEVADPAATPTPMARTCRILEASGPPAQLISTNGTPLAS
jgi:hypothetical protein